MFSLRAFQGLLLDAATGEAAVLDSRYVSSNVHALLLSTL
jgi:hypothetical protein